MTELDLTALGTTIATMSPGPWEVPGALEGQALRDATGIATLRNAAPELLRLARYAATVAPFVSLLQQHALLVNNDYGPTCERVYYGNGCPGADSESVEFWRAAMAIVDATKEPR